jgi:hypothetical protein
MPTAGVRSHCPGRSPAADRCLPAPVPSRGPGAPFSARARQALTLRDEVGPTGVIVGTAAKAPEAHARSLRFSRRTARGHRGSVAFSAPAAPSLGPGIYGRDAAGPVHVCCTHWSSRDAGAPLEVSCHASPWEGRIRRPEWEGRPLLPDRCRGRDPVYRGSEREHAAIRRGDPQRSYRDLAQRASP